MSDENIGTLGAMIDTLYATRASRLELTKQVDALKVEEQDMRAKILDALESVGLAKASGSMATVGITTKTEPVVNDWDVVHAWIREHDRFDLLQRRLSSVAWRELYESKQLVPGTESCEVVDISLTKSTRG